MKKRILKFPRCKEENKTSYPTEGLAGRGITLIWGKDPHADLGDLHVYQCSHGNHFHIGHRSYFEIKSNKVSDGKYVATLPNPINVRNGDEVIISIIISNE